MAVTEKQKAYLAVLIGNSDFKVFEIERDDNGIKALMDAESVFYGYMANNTPPPMDGSQATKNVLNTLFSETPEEEPEPADLNDKKRMLDTLMELEQAIAQMEEQRDTIKNQIILSIGEAWHGSCEGYSIFYKPQTRRTFDWKKLQKEYPNLNIDPFFKTSTSRPLSIKRIEEQSQ